MVTMNDDAKPIAVVLLPLPAQGHINQLLHLARHLSAHSIPVHYVGSAAHNRQARDRAAGPWDPLADPNLRFHDLPLPPYPTPPPNPNSPIKFPTHLQPAFDAALHLAAPLSSLLQAISPSCRRVVLIHDSAMSFAADAASAVPNVEPYVFHSVSAFTLLFFSLQSRRQAPPPSLRDYERNLTFEDCFSKEFMEFIQAQQSMTVKDHGRILNTCRALEKTSIELLQLEPGWKGQRVFALGPLNPIAVDRDRQHECLRWLDRQPDTSVVYVSFGTTTTLCAGQVAELAKGLASSGQRFLWVLREADTGDIYAAAGTRDVTAARGCQLAGRGLVVRGWAPQVEILAHRATAGFMSHCGWNSCMEGMSMGVPLLTWPMHSDQPRNALLVTEVLRVGITVRDWSRRREIVAADEIRDSIVKLMVGDEGKEAARRAGEIGEVIRECGSNKEELKAFIAYINR